MRKERPPQSAQAQPAPPISAELQAILDKAPRHIRRRFQLLQQTIIALDAAPNLKKRATARVWARRLGVSVSTIYARRCHFRNEGHIALLDKTFSAACWPQRPNILPAAAVQYLKSLASEGQLTQAAAVGQFIAQLARWREGDVAAAIPGYSAPPSGNPPPGWSKRNLARYLAPPDTASTPGPVLLKLNLTVRRQGNGAVLSVTQTLPNSASKPVTWEIKGPRR